MQATSTLYRFSLRTSATLWLVALCAVGCKGPQSLSELPVYSESFQRTYFEAQNHLAKGDPESAYSKFSQCLDLEPDESALHFDLGKIDLQLLRMDAAWSHFDAACSAQPENRWFHEYRATSAVGLELYDAALEDLLWVIESHPVDLEWAMDWALSLADAGAVDAALELCDATDQIAPNDPDLLHQKMYLLELKGNYIQIYQLLEKAVVLYPERIDFLIQWAQMLSATDQYEETLAALLRAEKTDPDNGLVQLELAQIWTQQDEIEKAQISLQKAFDSDEVFAEEKHQILLQYLQISAFNPTLIEPLEDLMKRALAMHPEDGSIRMLAADFAQGLGHTEEARQHMILVIDFMPHLASAWINLIALDAESGTIDAMYEHAWGAMERFPLEAEFGLLAGMAAMELERWEESVQALRQGLSVVFDAPELEGRMEGALGDVLHVLGQNEPAREAYERSLKKQPNDPSVLNNHAYYLALQKTQLERALECSSLAIELIPEEANFLDTHAWVLYQMGRYPEALDYITQALFLGEGTEPTFLEHDGDIRMAMGDTDGALNSWKSALMHGGNAEILNQKIREAS